MSVFVWGAGRICDFLLGINAIDLNYITGFVETRISKSSFKGKRIYSVDELSHTDYTCIIVANSFCNDVFNVCLEKKINMDKVCFIYPVRGRCDQINNLKLAQCYLTKSGYEYVKFNYRDFDVSWVEDDALKYNKLNERETFNIDPNNNYYVVSDKNQSAGKTGSYFWQDLWAAKKIISNNPSVHHDIGSRIDGFIAHLAAANVKTYLIDIRPFEIDIPGVYFTCSNATDLENIENESLESISALCSIEHFGLGRYGDPIDPEACFKCFNAIQNKTKKGGNIYISVPIGKEHVEFNAHRIFFAKTVIDSFDKCELLEFSCAKNDVFESNISINKYDDDMSSGASRFGLFHFCRNT